MTKRLSWRPKARLIAAIGAELVSSPKVALIELVKNAYDADATEVVIRLSGRDKDEVLEIIDNGTGMSAETVLNEWLVPATPAKRHKTRTSRGRRVLGEKGIGRFAAATLGSHLELVTRREGADEVVVRVDWDAFQDEEAFLDEVTVEYDTRQPLVFNGRGEGPEHGTLLCISNLKFAWNEAFEGDIRTALARLVSPFAQAVDFRIVLEVGGRREEIEPAGILSRPLYRLKGEVGPDRSYQVQIATPDGESPETGVLKKSRMRCGPFRIELRVWDRDRASLEPLAKALNRTVTDVRRDLDAAYGVSIYRDGFRVFPYGEQGNDWLGLDLRSRLKPGQNIANNQVVGIVEIGADTNPLLVDQSNREGIRESDAFEDLKQAVLELIILIENERHRYKNPRFEERRSKHKEDPLDPFRLSTIKTALKEAYPEATSLARMIADQEKRILKEVARYRETQVQFARMATLGGLVDRLLHEGRRPLALLRDKAQNGARRAARWPDPYGPDAQKTFREIDQYGADLAYHFKRLEPFAARGRGKAVEVVIEDLVREAARVLEKEMEQLGIRLEVSSEGTAATVVPEEVRSVFLNLLDNSVYWLAKSPPPRRILVSAERDRRGTVTVLFSDSGPGVPEKDRPYIFDPYYSTKPDGTGLGLSIAGLLVEDYYAGTLALVERGPLPGATFKITLRQRAGGSL